MTKFKFLKTKNRYKPLFQKFIKVRENVQNRRRLLKFKKQKWDLIKKFYERKIKFFKKFKLKDQQKFTVTRNPNKGTSFKKLFRDTLQSYKKFSFSYGSLSKKKVKKIINTYRKNFYKTVIKHLESRLDTVLYRAKFSSTFRNARQLISHKKILVNNKIITKKSYILKAGDLISIKNKLSFRIEKNFIYGEVWPIPPKHLIINYKTMQILFTNIDSTIHTNIFSYLNLEKILNNYIRH